MHLGRKPTRQDLDTSERAQTIARKPTLQESAKKLKLFNLSKRRFQSDLIKAYT